jgi:biopolymer transport protein ExbB/TolQ
MIGAVILLWLALVCVGLWATTRLAWRVWHQSLGLAVEIAATLSVASVTFALFSAVIGLQKIFGATVNEVAEPTLRVRSLAEGISISMNCTATALLVWVPSFIAAHVMLRKRRN